MKLSRVFVVIVIMVILALVAMWWFRAGTYHIDSFSAPENMVRV